MSVSSLVHCIAVLFFHLSGVQTIAPSPACPPPCLCEKTSIFNCASLGLFTVPSHIPATATSLDLSNNSLLSLVPLGSSHVYLPRLQSFWVGNNSLEGLSLCLGRGVESFRTITRRNRKCVSWVPNLQLLSAERNQLTCLPRGLGSVKSLQVLQLSHNRISELGPADFVGCAQLREVYLQHNYIDTIHPQVFKDLQKLQVLDLSYNLLTIIPMPAYLSLRNLNALVDVSDNKWQCDCNLKMIRRWLSFDSELGSTTWNVVCSSPSYHSGKDLLLLDESELVCPQPDYNKSGISTMTVDEGMELSLLCTNANQDLTEVDWWTPSGQVSWNQQLLHISNITEQEAGLYICTSGFKQEHVSVFNVHVRKRVHDARLRRETQNVFRDIGEGNVNTLRNVPAVREVTQSRFALAVCLSVFITFIVAFVLGIVLRPYLDKLCVKIRKKRSSRSSSNSRDSSTVPGQYVNEGFSDACEQPKQLHRASRVSFGGVTEVQIERDVEYDVTVEDSLSGNMDDGVIYQNLQRNECSVEMGKEQTEVPLREANKQICDMRSPCEYPNAETDKVIEFEHIPDPDESISSSSSCSSEHREVHQSYDVNATEQSVDSPTARTRPDTKLEFTTDPFSRISKFLKENMNDPDTDLWNDSGDSFSFTDGSPRLNSPASHAVYDFPSFTKEMSADEQPNKPSSSKESESGESEDYPTEYTVNPETDGESDTSSDSHLSQNRKLSSPERDITTVEQSAGSSAPLRQETITLDPSDVHMTFNRENSYDDMQFREHIKSRPFKITLDDEDEPPQYRVHPIYRTSQEVNKSLRTESSDTSSSSDNEDQEADYYPRRLEIKSELESVSSTPAKNSGMFLNINYDNTSSSTDIEGSSKGRERRTFKRLSGLSALLFTRSGTETNKKPVQSPPKPANTDSRSLIDSLGLYFKRQSVTSVENITPTADEDSFFASIGQAIDQIPKLKKRLAFSIAEPQPLSPHGTKPQDEATFKYPLSSSMEDSFFEKIGEVSHPLPKVKRYLYFSSMSYPEAPITAEGKIIHNVEMNTETRKSSSSSESDISADNKEGDFFSEIGASYDYLPKVKGYLQFSLLNNNEIITDVQTESKKATVKYENAPSICDEEDFFGQLHVSLEKIPKVKRYLLFQVAPFPSTHSSSLSNTLDIMPVLKENVERRCSSESESESESEFLPQPIYLPSKMTEATTQLGTDVKGNYEPASDENNFFQRIGVSVVRLPKISRYILFTAPPPEQPPLLSLNRQITLESTTKPESWISSSFAAKPDKAEAIFFEQVGPCLSSPSLPKVKRYIEFTRSDSHSSSSLKQTLTPVGSTTLPSKRPSYTSDDDTDSSTSQDDSIEGMHVSLENRPKATRSLQFVQSEPQLSNHQFPSLHTEISERQITLESTTKPESWRSSSFAAKPDMTEAIFFEQVGPCLSSPSLPKVKRYIEFIRSDSHSSSSLKQTLTPVGSTTLPSKRPSYTSDDDTDSSISQDDSNEGMHVSLGNRPKYVQSDSQLSNRKFPSSNTDMPERRLVTSPTLVRPNDQDEFFRQISPSVDVIPKLNRYIQFSHSEVNPPPQSLVNIKRDIVTESGKSSVSTENIKPAAKEYNFFESVGVSVDRVPKLKRYLNFTQLHVSTESPPPITKTAITPQLAARVESRNTDSSSEDDDTSLKKMPKLKRPTELKRSEPQSLAHTQTVQFDDAMSSTSKYNFFERIGMSLENMPKVKRSLLFSESEPQLFNPTASPSSSREPRPNQVQAEPFYSTRLTSRKSEDSVRSVTDRDDVSMAFDRIQRPKKSLILTSSDTYDQNQTHFPAVTSAINVNTESRSLSQITRLRKPPLFTRSDANVKSGDLSTSSGSGQRISSDSSSDTESSSPGSETTSKPKSKLGDSAANALYFTDSDDHSFANSDPLPMPRRHLVMSTELQDPIPASSDGNDAKDYLRDSSVARRRQERRRLMFQQKKRAMDGFSLSSQSFTSHDDEQKTSSSVPSSSQLPHSRMATETSDRANHKDTAASGYMGLSPKTLTSLRSKFTVHKNSDV